MARTFFPVALFRANKNWVTKESNLDRFIYTIDLWLRITGFGITRDNLSLSFFGFLLFLLSTVPYFLTCLLGVVYNYYYLSKVVGEASDMLAMETAFPFISCAITFIKAVWLLCSRREIYRVVTLAQELGPPVTMPKLFWVLTTMYVVMIYFSIAHRLIIPLIRGERILPEEYTLIPGLEEWVQTPNYEITYTIIGVGFYTIAPHIICFFSLYIGMVGHITAHYNKLGANMESLLHEVTTKSLNIDTVEYKEQLTQIIHHHCKLVDVTKNVRMLFNSIIGFDFVFVTVGIGVLLFQISRLGFSFLFDYIAYYCVTLTVYCIPGEIMCAAADSLPASVYSSGWEKFDPRERRSVLMILRSAQKQQALTAATFVPVNHATLMTILKTCLSIYAAFDAAKDSK